MKSIILSETQRHRLVAMCKKLFPEYTFDFSWLYGRNCEIKFWNDSMEHAELIHWFEFCTIYIMEKLLRDGGQREFSDYMSICFRYSFPSWDLIHPVIHPVDYLYEQFKKLL